MVIPKRLRQLAGTGKGQRALVQVDASRIILEMLPSNSYDVLAETVGNINYRETDHEKNAEEWLKKTARTRHPGCVRA